MGKDYEEKERGPKYTPPQELSPCSSTNHIAWCKSLDAQLKYQKTIKEEAKKCAENRHYKPNLKIGKRFKHFFDNEIIEAQQRAKRKTKRKKHEKNKKTG